MSTAGTEITSVPAFLFVVSMMTPCNVFRLELKGILEFSDAPLVSIDFNGNPHSAIVDGPSTRVIGNKMVKVLAWYDNEWGYSTRVRDLILHIMKK